MADAILSLIDRSDERYRMADAARRYALSQSWDAIMGGLRARYQHIIDEQPARHITGRMARVE